MRPARDKPSKKRQRGPVEILGHAPDLSVPLPKLDDPILVYGEENMLENIMLGTKTLEIRHQSLQPMQRCLAYRGHIYAVASFGPGKRITDVKEWALLEKQHLWHRSTLPYKNTFAHPIENVRCVGPIPFQREKGQIGTAKFKPISEPSPMQPPPTEPVEDGVAVGVSDNGRHTQGRRKRRREYGHSQAVRYSMSSNAPPNPIHICIARYGDRASDFSKQWSENSKLWQIQFIHDSLPSYAIEIVDGFNAYLAKVHSDDPEFPRDLLTLQKDFGIVCKSTKCTPNPQNAPLKDSRSVFYVPGDKETLQEALGLLHGYVAHRAVSPLRGDVPGFPNVQEQKILLHSAATVPRLDMTDIQDVPPLIVEAERRWSCDIFDCTGPAGNQFTLAVIAVVDDDHVAIRFSGLLPPFQEAFQKASIRLAATASSAIAEYVIDGRDGDVADLDKRRDTLAIFEDRVLHHSACMVHVVNGKYAAESAVAHFLQALASMPQTVMKHM